MIPARLIACLAVMGWFFIAFSSASAQPAKSADEYAAQAKAALEKGDSYTAWQAILNMDAADPDAWQTNKQIVDDAVRDLNRQLADLTKSEQFGRVVELGELLGLPKSAELIRKVYPQYVEQYSRSVETNLGNAYFRLGQTEAIKGNPDQAEANYNTALAYLQPSDPAFARAHHLLGMSIYDRGQAFFKSGRQQEARRVWQEAAKHFIIARDNSANDPDVRKQAMDMLDMFVGAKMVDPVPGLPTPTPESTPSPTPPPGFFARMTGSVSGFFSSLSGGGEMTGKLILGGGVLIAFIVLFWVVPYFILHHFERRGDIHAAMWNQKIKYMGIIALFGYAGTSLSRRKDQKASRKAHGCPHCGKPIDNMFEYDDLVFSRCPHCKNKIVPMYTLEGYIDTLAASMATDVERVNVGALSLDHFVKRDAMTRLIKAFATLGVRRRASDLHVEPDENGLIIRQRIDGIMTEMFSFPRSLSLAIVSAIKVSANMDIAEKRIPQDGKFQLNIDKTSIDVRVATSPTTVGEKASLRILDIRSIQMGTKHLGMASDQAQMFERAINAPHGMVLITGPTGSGKTTTIYVALQQLTTGNKNIISIEDPIEFRIPGVNQTQINPVAGLTFASGLRSILRQDPDVIVVGEIRDRETAEISVNAVQTGHLVFSTLHTVDASSSVARLIDFGVSPRQFADALSLIVAQRLIRLVCQYCKKPHTPDEATLRELGLKPPFDGFDFQVGAGCETCNNTGYYRRQGIFEMLRPSERMRVELENASLSTGQIRELAMQGGMRILRQEAIDLLKVGRTTAEETLRITK